MLFLWFRKSQIWVFNAANRKDSDIEKQFPSLHGSKIHYTLWGQDLWQKALYHESSGILNPVISHHTQEHAIALKLLSSLRMFVVVGATKTFGLLARVETSLTLDVGSQVVPFQQEIIILPVSRYKPCNLNSKWIHSNTKTQFALLILA